MKTIKFSDFMAKKHQITGLTHEEEKFAESFKFLFYILVAVAILAIPQLSFIQIAPIDPVQNAFLYS